MTDDYYRKIYVSDDDEERLVMKVNDIIKKISPGNLTEIEFNPLIQRETTVKIPFRYYKDNDDLVEGTKEEKNYVIKYTCLITELVEPGRDWFKKHEKPS